MADRVLLGMSGGVDSSIAVKLLKDKGYEVVGATMRLTDDKLVKNDHMPQSMKDAKLVADHFKIDHHEVDLKKEFRDTVIEYFIRAYELGTTPNPCIHCNEKIKFGQFLKIADQLNCPYVATGHYARVVKDEESGRYLLKKAKDPKKDQTYFLYRMSQEALARTIFPLGDFSKEEVRSLADNLGLKVAKKKDSEEICFVKDESHADFIERLSPNSSKAGKFIDPQGNVLGDHKGITHYTIGQRRGLGIALGKRAFVTHINPKTNEITIGDADSLLYRKILVNDINLIAVEDLHGPMRATVKIRHTMAENPALISKKGEDQILIEFDQPVRAPSKGQSAVFYDGEKVLGGGIIIDYWK